MNPANSLLYPKLETTGIFKKFSKRIEFHHRLSNQELTDLLKDWKLCTEKEAEKLYYGKIYRIKNLASHHLILQARKRGGTAYHYIDCRYIKHSSKIVMLVKVPNAGAYLFVIWSLIVAVATFFLTDKSHLHFSNKNVYVFLIYAFVGILIGIYFINASLNSAKIDVEREMNKILKQRKEINK